MNVGLPAPKIKIEGTITRKNGKVIPYTLHSVGEPTLPAQAPGGKSQNRNKE